MTPVAGVSLCLRTAFCALLGTVVPLRAWSADARAQEADDYKGHFTVLSHFHSKNGLHYPDSGLTQASDGNFYGVTLRSARGAKANFGGIYRIDPAGHKTSLHVFAGTPKDPANPTGEPIQASNGNLYGLTGDAGKFSALYRLTLGGDYTVLHSLHPNWEGSELVGSPVQGPDGLLYFVAHGGSGHDRGAVLTSTLDGEVHLLHAFKEGPEGSSPLTPLTLGDDGFFYGLTSQGGAMGNGTFYRISASGEFQSLASLDPAVCQLHPWSAWRLVEYQGAFYGACPAGGQRGAGTVIRLTKEGVIDLLHFFGRDRRNDGSMPFGGLVVDPSTSTLFGTTFGGGESGYGNVFKIDPDGTSYRIAVDAYPPRCAEPSGNLLLSADGYIYGTCRLGGSSGGGTVYRFHP